MAERVRTRVGAASGELNGYGSAEVRRTKTIKRRRREPEAEVRVVGSVDYVLLFSVVILVLFGIIMVFSASYMRATTDFGGPFHFLRNNIIFAGMGFGVMMLLASFNYELLRPFSILFYAIGIGLLVLVLVIGEEVSGATRWIELPVVGRFQPSELARAGVIFTLAYLIERYPKLPKTLAGIVFLTAVVGLMVVLIIYPGGFTIGLITAAIGMVMIAIAGPFFKRFVALGIAGIAGVAGYLYWLSVNDGGFRGTRYLVWQDPWIAPRDAGYQTIQSLFAIAGGRWFGEGIGNSRQVSFVPEAHNDIIFAIIVEELGFVGGTVIMILFAVFIWRGIIIAMRAPDTFSALLALGIVFAIGMQAMINIAVVTNSIPNTGVNLPFISYGGTSLVVSMAMVGVLLNISKYSVQKNM